MPRSSRSKSHKQSKHSSREYSVLNEDVKMKEARDFIDGKENVVSVKISKDSLVSGEKRKKNVNGNVSDEFSTPTKRRKEKIHGGSDRWNDDGEDESEVVDIDDTIWKSNDLLKAVGDSKSKTSRKHDVDKESGRNKIHNGKHEVEVLSKEIDNQQSKRGREHNEWPIEEELRNIELEKELKKRMKRRENYHDVKDGDGRKLSSKSSRDKDDIKHKDDKYRENSGQVSKSRDVKHRAESEKDKKHREDGNRYKNERYREDADHDHRHKNQRPRDDKDREKRERDTDHRDAKKLKYDSDYDRQTNKRGGSPVCDDRVSRHKDNKDRKRENNNNNKDEITDYRSREAEKISLSDAKINLISERGRSSSRDDMEITSNHTHHRSSSSAKLYPSRDHHRVSKQEETKYRDHVPKDRARQDSAPGESDKLSSRSLEKTTQKVEKRANDLSAEKRLKSDSRSSPSSTSKFSSFLPPQSPFKTVLDSPLNICNRGSGDPNMGSAQTSWKNWASFPLANSYTPFHHVPSSLFNPVMQQFPMFGGLPMNMNHAGFFGPGVHGWGSTSGGFGNWDHGRTRFNNQIWNGQGSGVKINMKSVAEKNDDLVHGPIDEIWTEQIRTHIDTEQIKPDFKTPEVMKVKPSFPVSMVKKDDDDFICPAYLSKIDISEDLTRSELYEQCQRMLGLDQASAADEFDCRILYLEVGVDADSSNGGSLFAAADDSVFKKAMSLYTKQKVQFSAMDKGIVSVSDQDQEKSCPVDVKLVEKALQGPVLVVSQEHVDPPVGNLDMNNMNEEDMEKDHPVENQEKEGCVSSVGGCEVEELDKQIVGGSLSVLNDELPTKLSEFGSVNLHPHSPESTH